MIGFSMPEIEAIDPEACLSIEVNMNILLLTGSREMWDNFQESSSCATGHYLKTCPDGPLSL